MSHGIGFVRSRPPLHQALASEERRATRDGAIALRRGGTRSPAGDCRGVAPPRRRSAGGQRVFVLDELEAAADALLKQRDDSAAVVVGDARVSSRRQAAEGDLERQIERLCNWAATERPLSELLMFSDIGSGLSDHRAGPRRALARVQRDDVGELVVTHAERLARFGTKSLELFLTGFGVNLTLIGEDEDFSASRESELVRDMLAAVTSFSGRLDGQRSAQTRALAGSVRKATTSSQ